MRTRMTMFCWVCLVAAVLVFRAAPLVAGPCDVPRAVPDTGQTGCYDTDGKVIDCPAPGGDYYGQDANYTINQMSFAGLSGGIMAMDNVTGLIWEVKHDCDGTEDYDNPHDADNVYTWYDPDAAGGGESTGADGVHDTRDFIDALNSANFGGHSDWRMPSMEELRFIVDYSKAYPGPAINTDFFPCAKPLFYWSSTTCPSGGSNAWGIDFGFGTDEARDKSGACHVRAVCGGE